MTERKGRQINQFTGSDILYQAPRGSPITELRKAGSNVVLYTEDEALIRRLKEWKQLLHQVKYIQQKTLVGVDLYFNKKVTKQLIKALENHRPTTSKNGVSLR